MTTFASTARRGLKVFLLPATVMILAACQQATADRDEIRRTRGCGAAAAQVLVQIGVPASSVTSSVTLREGNDDSGGGSGRIDAYVHHMRLSSCTGRLVIDHYPNCTLRQVYTTGDCDVEGVRNF